MNVCLLFLVFSHIHKKYFGQWVGAHPYRGLRWTSGFENKNKIDK